jgi:hypothetical protein
VDTPVKKCAIRVEAWTGRLIAAVMRKDLKDDGDYGNLRVRRLKNKHVLCYLI